MPAPVSIIIPCHNYGSFLAEAVESALGQTLPTQEIVIVDDGSTDDSRLVARRYAANPRVEFIEQANLGAIAAFHAGVRATTSPFFILLSADDRLDPRFIERTLPALTAAPSAAFAYTAYRLFGVQQRVLPALPYSARRLGLRPYIIGTVLMRRAAFDQVGGFDQSMAGALEDWDLFVRLAEHGWRGVAVPEVLFHYRRHQGGSRNTVGFRQTLALRARIYQNHRTLYRLPLGPFLTLTVLNEQYLRMRSAPRRLARLPGPRSGSGRAQGVLMVADREVWGVNAVDTIALAHERQEPPGCFSEPPDASAGSPIEAATRASKMLALPGRISAPPPYEARTHPGGVAASFRLMRACLARPSAVYHARGLGPLAAGTVAAAAHGAALIYEPETQTVPARLGHWWALLLYLVERALLLRVDIVLAANPAVARAIQRHQAVQPVILQYDPHGGSPGEVDRRRLAQLYADLSAVR